MQNLLSDRKTWLSVGVAGKPVCELPLIGYYFVTGTSGRSKGEILKIAGFRNHERYSAARIAATKHLPAGHELLEASTLLRLRYSDSLKRENEDFYLIGGSTVQWVEPEVGKASWTAHSSLETQARAIDVDSLADHGYLGGALAACLTLAPSSPLHGPSGVAPSPFRPKN